MTTELGYITMRNQDGTQYYTTYHGMEGWSEDYSDRRLFPREKFTELEAKAESTRLRDCPDNGFYGVYNLHFASTGDSK
jgi:hypothetical protein